jgi:ATP-dependent protease ClpP protease subunit
MTQENNNNTSRRIFLFSIINQSSVESVIKRITEINEIDDQKERTIVGYTRKPIELIIDSGGGAAYTGFALVDIIRLSKTPIHGIAVGHIMSMALPIFAVCHMRSSAKHTSFMYHEVQYGAGGGHSYVQHESSEAERLMQMYDSVLLQYTKMDKEKMVSYREKSKNWYMTAEEAQELGIVDIII